jgi:choline dehydrogenase-like flavoprotein
MSAGGNRDDADVLIVGSGLMGAGVAALIRRDAPGARIVMVDGGPVAGPIAGQHVHDMTDASARDQYNRRVSSGVQWMYVQSGGVDPGSTAADTQPGVYTIDEFGSRSSDMPGASVSWNVGGMGIHWTAACPWPYGSETFPLTGDGEWEADLAAATDVLGVSPDAFGPTPAGSSLLAALGEVFDDVSDEGRRVQLMPMAMTETPDGRLERTSPATIFPPLAGAADDLFDLRANALCTALEHDGGRVSGATIRDTRTGESSRVRARFTVVCADTLRTPQVLWASHIRPPALGRYLNEHAFLSGQVVTDADRLGIDVAHLPSTRAGEWAVGSYWLPHSGERQPFQAQIMGKLARDADTNDVTGFAASLSFYVPTEVRPENRIEFSDTETDAVGMPRATIHFSYSTTDLERIERARASQALAGARIGDFDPSTDSQLLPAGSSLHYTGTVRMGERDDGTSVCGPDARVWGFENLFVAGNGVVPTALACNSTLTGMITAVRAARSVSAALASGALSSGVLPSPAPSSPGTSSGVSI